MTENLDEMRFARIGLEAALAVTDSEAARAAWRLYHHALGRSDTRTIGDARRILDDAIRRSEDEQLIEAKQRFDLARDGATSSQVE